MPRDRRPGGALAPLGRQPLPPCPRCSGRLKPLGLLWQGIHLCAKAACEDCQAQALADLPTGHALCFPYAVDLGRGQVAGPQEAMAWLGQPLLQSLLHPDEGRAAPLKVLRRRRARKVVLLNCLDYLYGHALLKLLNAAQHRPGPGRPGLVVVVPECLAWMAPAWAAEVWSVGGPLKALQGYAPRLSRQLEAELARFAAVELSPAYPHAGSFAITDFTHVPPFSAAGAAPRATFIWREDRLWSAEGPADRLALRLGLRAWRLAAQRRRVLRFFGALRQARPELCCTLAGLGASLRFPAWVEDRRVSAYGPKDEQEHCRLYAESLLVAGVHGSSLLLPSAHAGMTLDLMPEDRWGNLAQDILYQESDPRLAAWRYRYVPMAQGPESAAKAALAQMRGLPIQRQLFHAGGGHGA